MCAPLHSCASATSGALAAKPAPACLFCTCTCRPANDSGLRQVVLTQGAGLTLRAGRCDNARAVGAVRKCERVLWTGKQAASSCRDGSCWAEIRFGPVGKRKKKGWVKLNACGRVTTATLQKPPLGGRAVAVCRKLG